ncbi:superfamily II DNA or RNA helicase [Flavobacterium nitrogenifigens]|uniref:Superfamily II DNA or RNA helicase n=2 Tax=Flavobacterium TaxID=237 RepID=A0A7W7N9T1_9FLAO|nr:MULTISPECIES: DEAD/DEAH box helicase family protein [Flavobacterium]MBB4803794.1 superfamily II DNA or RNA helicase [Flavobacterium nitrogenifigens]MBB6388401.1 superfamily II DNA or RNA helicase [Flavobacterium notoginsengisoli]
MLVNKDRFKVDDTLSEYPKEVKFKYNWRKYQQRVLDNLENHLKDGHLHIIAPPGSGKTVLGLEVAVRLNKPTLILTPTIAIRNQWIQRFCELFLQTDQIPDWISKDIRKPKFMTVVTYQGLHAACNDLKIEEEDLEEEDEVEESAKSKHTNANLEKIVSGLNAQKIKTIVVDEAHHLKNEWWQTLTKVKEKINPVIVGLTATPPYDVSPIEWQRYIELNGLVDMEISVPELVIEGDLCPHQDYVYFTMPTEKEHQDITNFRDNIEMLFQEIKNDETVIQAIETHPIWKNPEEQLDWIYSNFSYYSSSLIFLKANHREIPETHLEVIGDKKIIIPVLDYEWTEKLLEFYLFSGNEHFKEYEEHRKTLENRLRRYGAIERKQIDFLYSKKVTGFLASSISKLNGIKEIVDFEYNQLGKDLRMVILSDFIRKEYFVSSSENNLELNRLGVIPIFEKLRRENTANKKIGVLTGSLIIIPNSAYNDFETRAAKCGITKINSSIVPFDSDYVLINQTEQLTHNIVHIVTQIFQSGGIEVLIGTKSLLGEGWDAPAINSLILASFVGSFVLSNQMRGRAIRTQNGNSNKTGNIWHLVTIDETSPTGGDDFDLLKRRFKSFVGVSFHEQPGIENGIGRLNLGENIREKEEAEKKNIEMFKYAGDRENLKELWEKALETGVTLVEELKIPFREEKEYKALKSMYLNKTLANLLATLGSGLASFGLEMIQEFLKVARRIRSMRDLYFFLTFFGIVGVLFFGRQTLKALRLYFKYRDISKDIKKIGEALLDSLIKARIIQTNYSALEVITSVDDWGGVYCHLEGGTTFEKSTFINSLKEIIGNVENPRYIIVRKNRFMFFKEQRDYHSVPEVIGRNKKLAEHFKTQWKAFVDNCDLIFTRTIEGRKLLLQSRIKSLAAQFDEKAQRINKWK